MSESFERIALVTGVSSGIGEAIARTFVASGYGVVGNARTARRLADLEGELGPAFVGVAGDVSTRPVIDRLLAAAPERFGRPADIVVANAGRGLGGSVKDADLSRFDEMFRLNVSGTLLLMQEAARSMCATSAARFPAQASDIVVIGSVVGRQVSPFSAVYGATKFAVHGLVEGLRREVGPAGVRVTLVEPGILLSRFQEGAGYSDELVETFKQRFGPLIVGQDVASAVQFVVSQPPHVHVSDIVVRPTRQDYP